MTILNTTFTSLGAACVLLVAIAVRQFFDHSKAFHLPRVGKAPGWRFGRTRAQAAFVINSKKLVTEGYQYYKHSAYSVQTGTVDCVVLSHKYLPELRKLPKSHLSAKHAHYERHMAYWTGMDTFMKSDLHYEVVQLDLNQNTSDMIPALAAETKAALMNSIAAAQHGKQCDDPESKLRYTSDVSLSAAAACLPLHDTVQRVVSNIMNKVIIGEESVRDGRWASSTKGYMTDHSRITTALRPTLSLLRPYRYLMLPARNSIRRHLTNAQDVLFGSGGHMASCKEANSCLLAWMMDRAQGKDRSAREFTSKALLLGFASIHSTSTVLTNAVLDLCANPDTIPVLREEIESALAHEGGWTNNMIQRMRKVDSFLKESLRVNPAALLIFHRKVMRRIELSDGFVLPAGMFIAVCNYGVSRDPEYYSEPNTFQPMRFYDKAMARQRDSILDNAGPYKLSATSLTDLNFGYSTSACPGRHFAACALKLVFALLIHEYDVKFPHGRLERPLNSVFDEWVIPSREQEVEISLRA